MQFKRVQLINGRWVRIPVGLSAQQQADLMASLAPLTISRECLELLRQHEAGELISFETILAELLDELGDPETSA